MSQKPELLPERAEIIEDVPIEQVINEAFIRRLEAAVALYQERYLPLCLQLTKEADWVSHGPGRYSLQASGAEKVCNPLGIVWDRPAVVKHEREDDRGRYYEYEVEGIIHCRALQRYGWFTGNCSSRDQFFASREHFDEGDIRKAAFSNWLVNGVTRLAGIRNPSEEMLRKAGLDPTKITRIQYAGRQVPELDHEQISEGQLKRLWAIARGVGWGEDALKAFVCSFGYDSPRDIKRKDYDEIVAQIQRAFVREKTT